MVGFQGQYQLNVQLKWKLECPLRVICPKLGAPLGNALALGLGLSCPWPRLGRGSQGPRNASKPLDGPGLVPRILPPISSALQLLKALLLFLDPRTLRFLPMQPGFGERVLA